MSMIWILIGRFSEWRRKRWLTRLEHQLLVNAAVRKEEDRMRLREETVRRMEADLIRQAATMADVQARYIPETDDVEVTVRLNKFAYYALRDPSGLLGDIMVKLKKKIENEG